MKKWGMIVLQRPPVCKLSSANSIFDSVKYGLWFTEVDAKQRFGCNLKFYECIVVSKTEEHGLSVKNVLNIDTEMLYVLCYDL